MITEDISLTPAAAQEIARWDPRIVARFSEKSISEETRRAYHRVLLEFFSFLNHKHPLSVISDDVLKWRDSLRGKKRKAATVSLKLAVVRSFYEYLRAAGLVTINPASTKLVAPPEVSADGAGRALTAKEVMHLLAGPDQQTAIGARDFAILLLMLRTSLRVSEVCSLRSSSIKWSHGRWIIKFIVKGGRERTLPLPADVKMAIDQYLKLDGRRRATLLSDGQMPVCSSRTLTTARWYLISRSLRGWFGI